MMSKIPGHYAVPGRWYGQKSRAVLTGRQLGKKYNTKMKQIISPSIRLLDYNGRLLTEKKYRVFFKIQTLWELFCEYYLSKMVTDAILV